jgi:S-DNA-T family DNA segregation ATPase FtsK/SpoIIIE
MPATRKRAPARRKRATGGRRRPARRRRRGLPSLAWPPLRLPVLEQRQRDVLGLALLGCGIFMAFVLYGGWDGGRAGHALTVAFAWVLGKAKIFAPVALALAGAALLLRPLLPSLRPLRTGSLCLFAGVTLALAAGMLGLSAGPHGRGGPWGASFVQARGGIVGQALYEAAHPLVQGVGVGILVVFLVLSGLVLLSGATLAGAIRATGEGVADTTRLLRAIGARDEQVADGMLPPEPDEADLVVRSSHVEAPPHDELEEDFYEEEDAPPPVQPPARSRGPELQEAPEPEIPGVARKDAAALTPQGRLRGVVTDDPAFHWDLPDAAKLLTRSSGEQTRPDTAGQERIAASLVEALGHFGVEAKVIGTVAGPHITRYELRLAPGTKVGKVAQLKDDLAYALAATDIRILAPIPGKQAVGVEVPNAHRRIVRLGDVFQQPPADWSPLAVWLGKDVAGKAIGADLARMPHLLVAGTTGAGKSGAINAMLASILLRASPHEVRLVLVDPKQVELNHYESIPHLLTPVITSPRMAANALQNLVKEMEQRYGIMSLARTRGLPELNKSRERRGEAPLPYILCVIDELADLMMVAPADVEDSIIRLAQKARAVGIHLVLATQSPRVDVITGMIKANVPSRIAFAVSSQTDSRVILDQNGAESLLGQGDMLFNPVGSSRLQRIQGAYIDEPQIARLTELWRRQGEPELREELLEEVESEAPEGGGDDLDPDEDPLLADAIVLVAEMQTASTSMLQRRLRLGYTRAGRMIDMLERRGVISGYEGSKPRQVLITEADLPRVLGDAGRGERLPASAALGGQPPEDPPAPIGE